MHGIYFYQHTPSTSLRCANEGVLLLISSTFSKIHLTFDQQIELLESRGLLVTNQTYAKTKLEHISYYRLSAYFLPYQDEKDKFIEGTTFEDILELYYFDKELRKIIFNAIETMEVNIRANVVYNLSKETGAFGYMDKQNLHVGYEDYIYLMQSIQRETKRSKELFVKHFKKKYKSDVLPIWMVIELISFGTLSRFFSALKPEHETMTKKLGLPPEVYKNWLHTINHIRNICAHHSRLWNKQFVIKAKIPRKIKAFQEISNDRAFVIILILNFMFQKLGTGDGFMSKVEGLIEQYPKIDIKRMGFPEDWKERLE